MPGAKLTRRGHKRRPWGTWAFCEKEHGRVRKFWRVSLLLHGLAPLLVAAHVIVVLKYFPARWNDFFQAGPLTDWRALACSLGGLWLLAGAFMILMSRGKVNRSNAIALGAFLAFSLMHVIALRAHSSFADVSDYLAAARNILTKQPFSGSYIYPPMWASFLAVIWSWGGQDLSMIACLTINMLSAWLFFALCVVLLRRMGCSLNLAALVVLAILTTNVPIVTNLVCVQVNLLMMDLVLASVLVFERRPLASGALLAIGIHLKVVPIVFAPLFLARPNKKWIVGFVATGLGIAILTAVKDGPQYYRNFLENLKGWNYVMKQSAGIHAFVEETKRAFHASKQARRVLSVLDASSRVGLSGLAIGLSWLSTRKETFFNKQGPASEKAILNGMMPLFFLPIALQGIVWTHHLTLLIPPFLALTTKIDSKGRAAMLGVSGFLVFVMPGFDAYPWGGARVLGWILMLAIMTLAVLNDWRSNWPSIVDDRISLALGEKAPDDKDEARIS
jgi:hypothetical protein